MTRILILNTGSATFKWALFSAEDGRDLDQGTDEWSAEDALTRKTQIEEKLRTLPPCRAVGHRVVHGGSVFRESVVIDVETRRELELLVPLDTLHMRPAMVGIDAALAAFPDARQIASFDTAFHSTLNDAAAGYALPSEWTQKWGLRRFGFHGFSVEWSVDWVRRKQGTVPARMIVAHLGSGCSVTALREGRSVDTTMGFTPLEGLMMATRAGSVDPGVLMHLELRCGISAQVLEDTLLRGSGLLGVSGISGDMRKVLAAADEGNANARLAYDEFILYARRGVGAMSGTLGGTDMLVFTGGLGEHQPRVRRDISAALGDGLIDDSRNEAGEEGVISRASSPIQILTIRAREEQILLREVQRLIG
jgi:acetate kinase